MNGRRWLTSLVVVALLVAMAIQIARTRDELVAIERLSLTVIAAGCLLQFLSQLFLNASMLLPLRRCVPRLGFWELYVVRTGGFIVGSLVPVAGGIAVRLAYLRQRGVTYSDFTWATLLSNVLALAAAGVLGVLGTGALWLTAGRPPQVVLAVAAGVFMLGVAALAVFETLPRLTRRSPLGRWAWLSEMPGVRASSAISWGVFFHSLGRHLLNFITFGLLAQSLTGRSRDLLTGGVVYALTSPVRMVNITPGNLGVTEWVVALVGKALAFDLTLGLVAALAFRALGVIAQGVGVGFGSAWLAWRQRSVNSPQL